MEVPKITFPAEKKPLITDGAKFISSHDFSLTEKEIVKARQELSETEDKKNKCLQELRDKLAEDEDGSYRTDEEYLLRYLRVRKFDCKKAYENIRAAFLFKKKNPEFLKFPSNLEYLLNLKQYIYLPYVDEKGRVLLYMDIEKWNYKETSFAEIMQVSLCISDIIFMNPRCQINGLVVIWDVKGLSIHHISELLRNTNFVTLAYYMQNYYPLRLKNVFIVNSSRFSQLIYRMSRPFLTKKVSERISFLGTDLTELHQAVNPALLPKTLGGTLEEDQCTVVQNILDNVPYLKYERSFVSE